MKPAPQTQEGDSRSEFPGCVVIVDDIPDNLQLLTRTLRQHGYQVRAAATGMMGLETIQAEPPDLVLLDLMLRTWTAVRSATVSSSSRRRPTSPSSS